MWLFFKFFNVFAVKNTLFLQDDFSATSAGSLAGGLENIDKSIASLSSELTNSLKALGLKLDESASASTSAILSILNSEIQTKHAQLSEINAEIHFLLKSTNGLYNKCGGHRTCEACKYNPLCVWCDVEQICVGGDADGPFHGECSYFSYQACFTNGCRAHNRCNSCIGSLSCGWCLNGGSCTESQDNCDHILFVHNDIPGSACPVEEVNYPDVYISADPTGSENVLAEEAERRVIELRNKSVQILQDIQQLDFSKAKLISQSQIVQNIEVPELEVQGFNAELKEKVNKLAKKEAEELKERDLQEVKEIPKESLDLLNNQGMTITV